MLPKQPFDHLLVVAHSLGLMQFPPTPSGMDVFLPLLERMRSEGAVISLKWDGEGGPRNPYTVVVSGSPLQGDIVRADCDSLELGLARVIVAYAARRWGHRLPD